MTMLFAGNQVRDVRPPWKKPKVMYEEIPMSEKTSLLASPTSSDGELANVLGYASVQFKKKKSNDNVALIDE